MSTRANRKLSKKSQSDSFNSRDIFPKTLREEKTGKSLESEKPRTKKDSISQKHQLTGRMFGPHTTKLKLKRLQ